MFAKAATTPEEKLQIRRRFAARSLVRAI